MSDSEVRLEPLRALDQDSREGDHEPGGDVVAEDEVALAQQLHPPDIYTRDRTYWADLPWFRKLLWVNRQSNAEACRELRVLGRMMARDPLSPVAAYLRTYALNGLGLFVEGYTLFSVGNLVPLFSAVWPDCWKTHQVCDTEWQNAVDYLMIVGIVVGQLVVGIEGDWIGRRFGMVQNALIMTLGSIMLTAMWGATLNGWVICYAWSLFIYGLGVGGEYPMTSTHAMESSAPNSSSSVGVADRMHRGRSVSLAFLMQGWGQFANQLVLILLLLAFSGPDPPYGAFAAQWVFRLQFGFVAVATLFLAYVRFYHVKYPEDDARRRRLLRRSAKEENDEEKTGVEEAETYDAKSLWLATTHYWHRVVGTAGTWFCNDFFFYGNKIFAGVFIGIITGGKSTLMISWLYNLINIGVSLVGYYMAAILMDHKMYGRKWMQANGFAADFILFIIAAVLYDDLTQEGDGVKWFQFIYFFSSFWNQFGPNSTTFLLAAEVFPTSVRGTAHGVSAAVGKLGALAPAILYHYIDNHTKFWVVTWFGLAGWVLTMLFVPDTTGLDLREQERYWRFVAAGRAGDYHGVAVHPRHLSLWERIILRRHRAYDPALDREQRMVELCKAKVAREAHESSDCSSTCLDMSL